MIYTAIDTFYLTEEQLKNSPSRKDDINEATEATLRIYGCDLIQECGILLRLPQAVMATGQVLLHRFFCKESFAQVNVKRVAASCVWLASKLEESPRKARQVLIVFHRMECRRENFPIKHLDTSSQIYVELKKDLVDTERNILKEMGFICHVEHPHKFISNYLATLETPPELRQEAWNLANDSLRTTLCVRFKSEVVACGVIYAAARRFQVPLPENPPWWKAFDADKSGIDEVCRVLAQLYSFPKAQYIPVCKDWGSFTNLNRSWDSPRQSVSKAATATNEDVSTAKGSSSAENQEVGKIELPKATLEKPKDSKKSDEESNSLLVDGDSREEPDSKYTVRERNKERDREREKDRAKSKDYDRGREIDRRDRGREETERGHRWRNKGKDSGRTEKSKHHSTQDRDYQSSSYSSREKDRRKH